MTRDLALALLQFVERGGPALWVILALSSFLWVRIGQGYAFLYRANPRAGYAGASAASAATRLALDLGRRVQEMEAIVAVLPLVGLLGTVGGMIEAFDVLAQFGSTNPRGLSLGISQALLSTMAGLVTALAGFFAVTPLARAAARAERVSSGDASGRDGFALSPMLLLRARLHGRTPRQEPSL